MDMDGLERRVYRRGTHFDMSAEISRENNPDIKCWKKIEVVDLSSGGFQMYTDELYEVGEFMWVHLLIRGFLSQFELTAQVVIRRVKEENDMYLYGVSFRKLANEMEVLIDENVQNDRPMHQKPYTRD